MEKTHQAVAVEQNTENNDTQDVAFAKDRKQKWTMWKKLPIPHEVHQESEV